MKRGDIVDIRYRGTVTYVDESGDMMVRPDGATEPDSTHIDYATLVTPAYRVGDLLVPGCIEPAPGTIIGNPNGNAAGRMAFEGPDWWMTWVRDPLTWKSFQHLYITPSSKWRVLQVPE